jgi:two-component system, cell cycle sensor histidine kinase PleC
MNQALERRTIELKHAVQARSEFLANMSHELRTPLNSINGFSEVLFDETFGALNNKQKEYVTYVLTSGKHLLSLINDVLDMAKVDAGKMELVKSEFSVKSLLEEAMVLVKEAAFNKRLEVSLDVQKSVGAIEADERKVKQVVYNLLSNAVKFTPDGGKLGIRARQTASELEITVWDTGIGIPTDSIGKLFETFARVDSMYGRNLEGSGLGLALSKKLVELHDGKISIESPGEGKGTVVKFVIPIR